MKLNYSSILLIFGILLIPNISFAKTFSQTGVADVIPVVGRIDSATQSWSGSLITDFDSRMPVNIDATMNIKTGTPTESQEMYFDNTTGTFSGFFVLTAACATTSCKDTSGNWDTSAFVALNHGATGVLPATLIDSGDHNIYNMSGFAWSKSSGWIAFNVGSDPVKYNSSTSSFSGFAWSKNLGYISMNGLKMKTKPSILLEKDVTVANDSAILGYNSGSFDGLGVYRLMLNSIPYASNNGEFLSVDIHEVLSSGYNYVLLDPFGNKTAGKLQVVANVPSDTCTTGSCPVFDAGINASATATENGNNFHKPTLSLHDKYGNLIHTEYSIVNGSKIKEVGVKIGFTNDVWADQSNISSSTYKAIAYDASGTVFSGSFDGVVSKGIDAIGFKEIMNASDSVIPVIVSSIAPTNSSSGYTLQLDKFVYQITGVNGYTDTEVGGATNDTTFSAQTYNFKSPITNPAVTVNPKIAGIALQTGEPFVVDAFSVPVSNHNMSNPQVNLLFDFTTNAGSSLNTIIALTGGQVLTPQMGLNKIGRYISGFVGTGELTPTINIGGAVDPGLGYKFSVESYLKYTASGVVAIIPYAQSGDQTVKNRGIKIIGTTSTSNSGSIFALSTQNEYTKVGNFSKPQVKDFVRQNVEAIIRNKPNDVTIETSSDYTYPVAGLSGKRTLIVKDHDLFINSDVGTAGSVPMAIIVLNGNIKIGPDVKNIYASIFTDKGLYAVKTDGSLIDDSSRSSNQLYIFGTLISGNTVGTSAQSASEICPDFLGKNNCTPEQKKQYDLNFLRTGPTNFASAISSETDLNVYPVVIRYNPKLTSDPPPGFKKMTR